MAKQEQIEKLLADMPELPRFYEVAGGIDLVNGLYEISLLEDGDAIPAGRGGYGGGEFAGTPVDKRYHWVKKEPEETGTEIWWSTSWCWGLSYTGHHHYCDEGGSSIAAHKALAPRNPDNLGRLPRPVFVPRTKFGNPMGADESWSPVTLTPISDVRALQLTAAPGDGARSLHVTAFALSGEEVAQVPLPDGEGAQELRQRLCSALSLGPYSVKAVLPNGELLRNVGSAAQLRELLVVEPLVIAD